MTEMTQPFGRRKSPDAFRTIGEAASEIGVEPHVLRFWETKFSRLKPLTRAGGRRYYRPEDLALLRRIRSLLHEDGLTIRGAQKVLQGRHSANLLDALSPQLGEDTSPAKAGAKPAPLQEEAAADLAMLRHMLVNLAAEARSISDGGPIPPNSATD